MSLAEQALFLANLERKYRAEGNLEYLREVRAYQGRNLPPISIRPRGTA
jgi:hypothetical protein